MKCYFCLTEPDERNSVYLDLLYVSLKSARQNTNLDLYVIYDGSENGRCYEILKEFDVHIIKQEFSHKQYLKNVYTEEFMKQLFGKIISLDKVSGSFMRLDIPFIEQEDEYVFYADIDVMFLRDFSQEDFGKPKYLAATAEFDKDLNKMTYFNSGIMYLNVQNMKEISNQIFELLKQGIRHESGIVDQGYLNQLCFDKMTVMPIEFNWKPYWGYNKDAYIIHLHAMKPGGNYTNSGFAMSEFALYYSLKEHYQDIDGYVYYMMKYYEFLGQDGKEWISNFISQVLQSILLHKSKENEQIIFNEISNLKNTEASLAQQLTNMQSGANKLEENLAGLEAKTVAENTFKQNINTLSERLSDLEAKTVAENTFKQSINALSERLSGLESKMVAENVFKQSINTLSENLLRIDSKIMQQDVLQSRIYKLKKRRSFYKILSIIFAVILLTFMIYVITKATIW